MPAKRKKPSHDALVRPPVARGLEAGAAAVDREANVIHGYSVIRKGMAKGHGFEIDDVMLDQVVEFGNKTVRGLKSRFGHPSMSSSAVGTTIGRSTTFRRDGDCVRADLEILDSAFDTPKGNLGDYTLNMAAEAPDLFGASIVFYNKPLYRLEEDGTPQLDDNGEPLPPLARLDTSLEKPLLASDVVDEPAANEEGMFGVEFADTVGLSAEMSSRVMQFMNQDDWQEKLPAFLAKIRDNEVAHGGDVAALDQLINLLTKKDSPAPKPPKVESSTAEEIVLNSETQTQKGDSAMTPEEMAAKAAADQAALDAASKKERDEAALEAKQNERARVTTLTALAGKIVGVTPEMLKTAIDSDVSVEQAAQQWSALELDKGSGAAAQSVTVVVDQFDNLNKGLTDSFCVRLGVERDPKTVADSRKSKYSGLSIQEAAREYLTAAGSHDAHLLKSADVWRQTMGSRRVQFGGNMAQGSGDFTAILSNTLRKVMYDKWQAAETTYQLWTGTGTLRDFKTNDIVKGTEFSDIAEVAEGDASKSGAFNDTYERVRLAKHGRQFSLTREAMINDDLNWFSRVPGKMMGSMRRYVNRRVYSYLFNARGANADFVGPTMLEDNVALFNLATHANYLALGTGAAIAEGTMNAAWIAFKNQTIPTGNPDGDAADYANVSPRYCIAGPRQTMAAAKLFGSVFYNTDAGDADGGYQITNIFGPNQPRSMTYIEEPMIDQLVTSTATYPWYLAASPEQMGTISVYTLDGESSPRASSRDSFVGDPEGQIWEILFDFEVGADDWRGMYLNTGR